MIFLYIFIGLLIVFSILGKFGLTDRSKLRESKNVHLMNPLAAEFVREQKGSIGFLLVHGYGGTPFTMSFLADYLYEKGFSVMAPRLPGHGTNIKDFHKARYRDYLEKVKEFYFQYRSKYKYFFVAGFSLGGNLSLNLITSLPQYLQPTGVITFSAPVILNGFLNGKFIIRDYKLLISGIIKYFVRAIPKRLESEAAMKISPWIGYNWFHSTASVHSVKLNIPKVRKNISKLKIPFALAHSQNDKTVDVENSYYAFRKANSSIKRILILKIDDDLTSCHRIITHIKFRQQVFEFVYKFVEEVLSKEYLYQLKNESI